MDKLSAADAASALVAAGSDFARLLERPQFDVSLYKPKQSDPQTPHLRDEIYVIVSGSGDFTCGAETNAFGSGDVFFVPAGTHHQFTNFSDSFATWVIFIGPRPAKQG